MRFQHTAAEFGNVALVVLTHSRPKVAGFTRIGTRLMREEYGSLLPELLDQPITPALLLQCQAAAIAALAKWEPRIEIQAATVSAADANDAKVIINIEAVNISTGTLETYSIRK